MFKKKNIVEKYISKIAGFIRNKITIYIAFLIIVIVMGYIFYFTKNIKDQTFYYYLFSSIIQGFLALVGVLGAAVIYKMQLIENNLNLVKEKSINFIRMHINGSYDEYSWKVVKIEIEKQLQESPENLNYKDMSHKFNDLSEHLELIKNDIIQFSSVTFVTVAIAFLGLPLSNFLLTEELYVTASTLSFVTILLSLYLLLFSLMMIFTIFVDIKRK